MEKSEGEACTQESEARKQEMLAKDEAKKVQDREKGYHEAIEHIVATIKNNSALSGNRLALV